MKKLIAMFAVAVALGLSPAAALAQAQPAQAPAAQPAPTGTPAEALPLPAQPQDASAPASPTATPAAEAATPAQTFPHQAPTPGIGQPDGRMGLQDQFSPIGVDGAWFHDVILMPIITVISLFVLGLMIWVVMRYRRRANPTPSRTTHNTLVEVIWILVPVLILAGMAFPSFRLLADQYDPPEADLTVKVIGNQWYWTYQYPDNGDFEVVSNMLSDEEAKKRGEPRLLAVDERMVVPAGATVKLIVTSNDVLHAFAVPAFWAKMDAVPGKLNETWFKVDRPGVYYGQCSELCGARHGYMPIAVEVVPPAQYAAWVASKGGTMPGAAGVAAAASPDATANSPISNMAAPGAEGDAMPEPALTNATATAVPVEQAATSNPRVAE